MLSKFKLYEGNPKIIDNKYIVTDCSVGYKPGQKKASLHLPEDQELKGKWIYFVNRKDWSSTAHSVICIDHLEEKFTKRGKKRKNPTRYLDPVQFIMIQNPVSRS